MKHAKAYAILQKLNLMVNRLSRLSPFEQATSDFRDLGVHIEEVRRIRTTDVDLQRSIGECLSGATHLFDLITSTYLDSLTSHTTPFSSWEQLCRLVKVGKEFAFDMRIPEHVVLAAELDKTSNPAPRRFVPIDEIDFSNPSFKPPAIRTKVSIREEVIALNPAIPPAFKFDSRDYIDRVTDAVFSYERDLISKFHSYESNQKVEAMKKRVYDEYDLGRFKQGTIDKLHSLAWEHGHANGLSEVECQYSDLVELLETTL